MKTPPASLLKYDHPLLVRSGTSASKGRTYVVSPNQSLDTSPVPPPPKQKAVGSEIEDIFNTFLPPREWEEGTNLWVQSVSSVPSTRADVVQVAEKLDFMLKERQARNTGICPIRREIYTDCFDEIIRQVTINCSVRGLLLVKIRQEINMTMMAYQRLYVSSMAFGMRKAMLSDNKLAEMEKRLTEVEEEKQALKRELNEEKVKCQELAKREAERHQVEEKKLTGEIAFLKNTNQQLKSQLELITTPK